jgi:two-component system NtrC family sensor kinase
MAPGPIARRGDGRTVGFMVQSRTQRHAIAALLVGALLATLGFLVVRSVVTDLRGDSRALELLRELKDFDARRDSDARRLADDFNASASATPDRAPALARTLRELEAAPTHGAVSRDLPALRSAVADKDAAFQALRLAHAATLEALAAAEQALAPLAMGAASARLGNPDRASNLGALVETLRTRLRDRDIDRAQNAVRELDSRAAELHPAAIAVDPFLGDTARRADAAIDAFIGARLAEAAAWRKLAYMTTGGRIELATQALSRKIERELDDQARWRIYLLAYAAALALGVTYLGLRLVATVRALRHANATLELRCSERSGDLARMLRRVEECEARLARNEKMASLGQLVTGMADEITAPLALLKGHLSNARSALPDLRAAHEEAQRVVALAGGATADRAGLERALHALAAHLEQLRSAHALDDLESLGWAGARDVEQVMELASTLRSFARLDAVRVASFNVNDGVHATLLMARPLLRKIDVEKALGDVPQIACSPSQVRQVLLNLVTHAAQSIDKPRGRITVATRLDSPGAVAIDISDDGKGIAPDRLATLFDPPSEGDPDACARLGLSIAHRIVQEHGGRIEVRSQLGAGSTFTVTLPVQPPAAAGA